MENSFLSCNVLSLWFHSVLEYIDGKWVYDGSGPPGALGEKTARKYLRDIVAGLMYLHAHVMISSFLCVLL